MKTPELPRGVTLHRGSLRIAFRPAGRKNQIKRSLGIVPTKANIRAAETKLHAIKHDIMLGKFDIGDHFPNDPLSEKNPFYLTDILQEFYIDKLQAKHNTQMCMKSLARVFGRACAKMDGRNMTPPDAVRVQNALLDVTTPGQTNRLINKLKKAMTRAKAVSRVEANPFDHLEPVKVVNKSYEQIDMLGVYTIEESERLAAACKNDEQRRYLTFLFWTGMRPGEVAALERQDLDLPHIIIRRNMTTDGSTVTPKTQSGFRKILLPAPAKKALLEQLQFNSAQRIFTKNHGEPLTSPRVINTPTFKRICARANIRYLTVYRARHSFISWMLAAGEPPITIAKHVGHKNTTMIEQVYAVFIPKNDPKWTLDDPNKLELVKKSMKSEV